MGSDRTLLGRLGEFVVRRRRRVLAGGLLFMVLCGVVGAGAMGAMVLNRWEAPGTESVRAQEALIGEFGTDSANLILLISAKQGTVDDPDVASAGTEFADRLAGEESVGNVWSYWSRDRDSTMRSEDGRHAVVLAWVEGAPTEARAEIAELIPEYTQDTGVVGIQVAGSEAASSQISELARQDFLRAELIIIPLMLLLLIVVYRRVSPALLTLGVGLFSVLVTLAALRGLTAITEVSTFAANITLVMGVGLGIDYSLFIVSRFREELARGEPVGTAVVRTVRTAGRTVIFSGLTVAASLSMLLLFPYSFLRSFGYAGILVVLTAVAGALVLLPAALAVLGRRVTRRGAADGQPDAVTQRGFWYRLGSRVMARPRLFGGVALIVVVVLGSPVLGLQIGLPDDRVLPPTASTRQAYDELRANFSAEANDAIQVVAPAAGATAGDLEAVGAYAGELSTVAGVAQVNSPAGVFADGERIREPGATTRHLTAGDAVRVEAIPTRDTLAGSQSDVERLIGQLRAVPAPFDGEVLVGGDPAELTDFRTTLMDRVPLVAVLILLITFGILFLMSGSLLIPIKATVLNLLSLGVMFGALVFIFQNGAFAELLGFTPIGTLDPAFPVLMFCVAYGLSMDYEVFLVSRIKEQYDSTGDNTTSVLYGLQRSAPLVTAAGIILALSFSLYATGQVMYLQMIGVGTAIAILVDTTIIRAILLPALMRLAGNANWWAPGPLRRIHQRFGIREHNPPPSREAAEPPAAIGQLRRQV